MIHRVLDFLKSPILSLVYHSGCSNHPVLHFETFSVACFLVESAVFINLMVKLKDSVIPLIPSHCACGFNDFTINFMLLEVTTDHCKSDSYYYKPGKHAYSCSVGDGHSNKVSFPSIVKGFHTYTFILLLDE